MRLIKEIESELELKGELSTGIDIIGTAAILKLDKVQEEKKKEIADAILSKVRSVKSVYEQLGSVQGTYRTRKLRLIRGVDQRLVCHKENGLRIFVDVENCYFSPRLSTERARIASFCKEDERVLNMFAGVGSFSLLIARKGARVVNAEINRIACILSVKNNIANRVSRNVDVINTDSALLPSTLRQKFDRIIMQHPSSSNKYLEHAMKLSKKGATIHYYRHVREDHDHESKLKEEISSVIDKYSEIRIRKVREVGPRTYELVADITLA